MGATAVSCNGIWYSRLPNIQEQETLPATAAVGKRNLQVPPCVNSTKVSQASMTESTDG